VPEPCSAHSAVFRSPTAQAPPAQAALLAELARRMGRRAAKGLMLGRPGDRQPTREATRAAAAKTTITRFTLTGQDSAPRARRPLTS